MKPINGKNMNEEELDVALSAAFRRGVANEDVPEEGTDCGQTVLTEEDRKALDAIDDAQVCRILDRARKPEQTPVVVKPNKVLSLADVLGGWSLAGAAARAEDGKAPTEAAREEMERKLRELDDREQNESNDRK